jgi:hypothetical protein
MFIKFQKQKTKKQIMKTKFRLLRWLMMLILSVSTLGLWAQNQNPTQTVCLGTQTYSVDPVAGATFVWGISAGGTITSGNGTQNITIDWTIAGGPYTVSVYSYKVIGCPSITQSVSVTVVSQPTGPTLNVKTPNLASVCDGTNVSATFIAGSGGVGCSDAFQYRFDGVGLWTAYTPGNSLSTTGHTLVDIQGQRSGCASGAGCTGTSWVTLASWTVNPNLPVSVTIVADNNPVCAGTSVTYTATPVNGGAIPVFAWYVNGAVQIGTSATFVYVPVDTDQVYAMLTSNATCATGSPATSNTLTMTVNTTTSISSIWHY